MHMSLVGFTLMAFLRWRISLLFSFTRSSAFACSSIPYVNDLGTPLLLPFASRRISRIS